MKDKTLFDAVPESIDDQSGEQTHFASLKLLCEPVQAWGDEQFGPCRHMDSFKYLSWESHGVTVKAEISELSVQWRVGYQGKVSFVGTTLHGDDLIGRIPGPVVLAAEYVKLKGK